MLYLPSRTRPGHAAVCATTIWLQSGPAPAGRRRGPTTAGTRSTASGRTSSNCHSPPTASAVAPAAPDHFYARLGFGAQVRAVQWQEHAKTFTRKYFNGGIAAPFLIRMSDLVIAYQPRKQGIRQDTFVATLREMLRYGKDGAEWRIESPTGRASSFDAWREDVTRITRLRFSFEHNDRASPPMPSTTIDALLGPNPDRAAIEWWAESGLDADDPLVRELHDQVVTGLGEMTADGRRDDAINAIRQWTSKTGEETVILEVEIGDDDDEVSRTTLAEHLQFIDKMG